MRNTIPRSLVLFALLLHAAPGAARPAGDTRTPVIQAPTLPAAAARATWGDSPAAALLEAGEYLRTHVPARFMDYPGKRDQFDNLESGPFDITRVDADVYVDVSTEGTLRVDAWLTLVPLEPSLKKIDFLVELPDVLAVASLPDVGMTWERIGSMVRVEFPPDLAVEEEFTLFFQYEGEMDCDVQFMLPTCRLDSGWKYVTHSQFLPQLGSLSTDMFTGTMRLLLSGDGYEEWHAGGTGTFQGTTLHPEEGVKELVFEHVLPTSLYAWSTSKMVTVHSQEGETPISATVQPKQAGNMGTILGIMRDVLAFYNQIYVVYPWNKLDLVAMPKSFSGGFGPLSTIFVTQSVLDASPDNNSYYGAMQLISHEMGHQWWGNLVEMADSTAVVLSEGLAEFSSNLHFEHVTGSRYGFVGNNMAYAFTVPYDEEPLMVSPYVYSSPYYYQVAYQKGATVIDMLRLELGDEVLLEALHELSDRFYMKFAYPEDLLDVLEDVSGVDLDYFYDQWLAGRGSIRLQVGADCGPGSEACRLHVAQKSLGGQGAFQFNLPVSVLFLDGTVEDLIVRVDDWEQVLDIPVDPAKVRRLYLDHRRQLARIWRPMLPGDLDLNGVVDGADLVEMSWAYQLNLLVNSDWGEYFYPNVRYDDLADMASEEGEGHLDGRVDEYDLDALLEHAGARLDDQGGGNE